MTNFEKIIILLVSLVVIIVLAFGAVLFNQQKAIRNLESGPAVSKATSGQVSKAGNEANKGPGLTSLVKSFSGEINGISENELAIKAKLIDYVPKNPEKLNTNEPVNLTADDFGTMEKNIKVNVSAKTVFPAKKLADLKIGDSVIVIADKSPYESNTVTAEIVTVAKTQ
jgi:hypothetical protein